MTAIALPEQIAAVRGDKSLTFESGLPVPRGEGSCVWNFLPVLERVLWPAEGNANKY